MTRALCRSKVTGHDALYSILASTSSAVQVLNFFSMLLQCGINLWSYQVNFQIAEKTVLLYFSISLYKILARYRYYLRVPSVEPGSKKRCLFRRGDFLFYILIMDEKILILCEK